eukprot:gb/GECG01010935.1/.p1 GENE.gb/GECG01010935.1/~~gb/GECG01010935.1/.p1  ORF type:complete len:175 (+),score=20.61 gb/GECG01010935.1/:1-525(+)
MLALRRALTSSVKRTIPVCPAFSQVLISKTRRSHEQGKTRWNNRMLATTAQASYGQEEAEVDDEHYEEVRQKQSIKPVDFYEYWAQQRRYFYYVDNQGRLFIEDVLPKNIATSLKSEKFLNFFWKQIRRNDQEGKRNCLVKDTVGLPSFTLLNIVTQNIKTIPTIAHAGRRRIT